MALSADVTALDILHFKANIFFCNFPFPSSQSILLRRVLSPILNIKRREALTNLCQSHWVHDFVQCVEFWKELQKLSALKSGSSPYSDGEEMPTLLGPLETANLNHWICSRPEGTEVDIYSLGTLRKS
jgi:hypothetical protein